MALTAAVAAVPAAISPVSPAIVAVAPPIVFALSPALVDPGILDYSSSEGKKIYTNATKSLYEDSSEFYDGKANKLASFLHKLRTRADEYGWAEGILDVDVAAPGAPAPMLVGLLDHYGEVTVEQV